MSQYHGLGRLSLQDVKEGITADLQLVEDYFDGHHQQPFVMGHKASSADCTVFAFLLLVQKTILADEKASEPLFSTLSFPKSEAYVRRLEAALHLPHISKYCV